MNVNDVVERKAMHAYLSLSAHDAFQHFAEENGVSVTGLIQAMCEELDEEVQKKGTDIRQDWVRRGRKVDARRRRRY